MQWHLISLPLADRLYCMYRCRHVVRLYDIDTGSEINDHRSIINHHNPEQFVIIWWKQQSYRLVLRTMCSCITLSIRNCTKVCLVLLKFKSLSGGSLFQTPHLLLACFYKLSKLSLVALFYNTSNHSQDKDECIEITFRTKTLVFFRDVFFSLGTCVTLLIY